MKLDNCSFAPSCRFHINKKRFVSSTHRGERQQQQQQGNGKNGEEWKKRKFQFLSCFVFRMICEWGMTNEKNSTFQILLTAFLLSSLSLVLTGEKNRIGSLKLIAHFITHSSQATHCTLHTLLSALYIVRISHNAMARANARTIMAKS